MLASHFSSLQELEKAGRDELLALPWGIMKIRNGL